MDLLEELINNELNESAEKTIDQFIEKIKTEFEKTLLIGTEKVCEAAKRDQKGGTTLLCGVRLKKSKPLKTLTICKTKSLRSL